MKLRISTSSAPNRRYEIVLHMLVWLITLFQTSSYMVHNLIIQTQISLAAVKLHLAGNSKIVSWCQLGEKIPMVYGLFFTQKIDYVVQIMIDVYFMQICLKGVLSKSQELPIVPRELIKT